MGRHRRARLGELLQTGAGWGNAQRPPSPTPSVLAEDRTAGYTAELVNVTAGIRHRFSDRFNVQVGGQYETGRGTDVLGDFDYTLVGIPASFDLDASDSRLDPREGFRIRGGVTPYLEAFGSSVGFTYSEVEASAYVPIDAQKRYVIAGRVEVGSLAGAELNAIPSNRRFFSGGGGSVRGYAYRSLGPQLAGQPIGGRSLFEASLEARLRITDTIGIVPFVDAGSAFRESYPSFASTSCAFGGFMGFCTTPPSAACGSTYRFR